jgi:hypothetical protein
MQTTNQYMLKFCKELLPNLLIHSSRWWGFLEECSYKLCSSLGHHFFPCFCLCVSLCLPVLDHGETVNHAVRSWGLSPCSVSIRRYLTQRCVWYGAYLTWASMVTRFTIFHAAPARSYCDWRQLLISLQETVTTIYTTFRTLSIPSTFASNKHSTLERNVQMCRIFWTYSRMRPPCAIIVCRYDVAPVGA